MTSTSPGASTVDAAAENAAVGRDASSTATSAAKGSATAVKPADRFMLRLLRIKKVDKLDEKEVLGAHRAFRLALVFTAVRCIISYVAIPILVPLISFMGVLATPISVALCLFAFVNGVMSLRRFWKTDHRGKWLYTWFIAFVFVILAVTLVHEFSNLGVN
ncbi:hypothetical protein [Corynebacterium sputi]|uniref:hypothetical protein n=1 Tax=Corynebacterium sputi TaxID=489915 RepID=UPI0003F83909|nr:hypothetical protein [Corynebacterium sputi]